MNKLRFSGTTIKTTTKNDESIYLRVMEHNEESSSRQFEIITVFLCVSRYLFGYITMYI